jgi:hypothetical protein
MLTSTLAPMLAPMLTSTLAPMLAPMVRSMRVPMLACMVKCWLVLTVVSRGVSRKWSALALVLTRLVALTSL